MSRTELAPRRPSGLSRNGAVLLVAGLAIAACTSTGSNTRVETAQRNSQAQLLETLPAGAEIEVQLEQSLSTEDTRPGARWSGVVVYDVTDGQRVLLQRGSVIGGEVTRAGETEIEGETRQVLALDPRTLEADGQSYPIEAEIVRAEQHEDVDILSRRNVALVGGGALAGGILGELLLDDAVLGAVLGAAGGTAVAIANRDTHIELPAGSRMTLELERSVQRRVVSR